MVEDDPDRRSEFCKWFQRKVDEDAQFVDIIVWSDEATFKLSGTVNQHNCTYCSSENLNIHVDKALNLPGLTVWCGVLSSGIVGLYFFEGTVTGAEYLTMLEESIVPAIRQLCGDDKFNTKKTLPHYHITIMMSGHTLMTMPQTGR
jgi:hypothetical protein